MSGVSRYAARRDPALGDANLVHSATVTLATMTAPTPLHPDAVALLHTLDESQPGSTAKLVRLFAADAPALLSRIELGHERGDLEQVNQAAHFLRSSALALGVTQLADAAFRLEHLEAAQLGSDVAELRLAQLRVSLRDALLTLLDLAPDES